MMHRPEHPQKPYSLRIKRFGIDTYQEAVIYMRRDCHVCRAEGFEAQARVAVNLNGHKLIATLNVVVSDLLAHDEVGLSEAAWRVLDPQPDDRVTLAHLAPLDSLRHVRAKVYGHRLADDAMQAIMNDVVKGLYSDIEIAAFIAACAGTRLDLKETIALTRAMIAVGERLSWDKTPVVDKHCVGGLPGNRTTLIVVPIVTAFGLTMPKTSSRSITSPAGTADVMETLAEVKLDAATIQRVVQSEGGCIAWGGAVRLSPADDILIRVERPLDLDSEGQLVASVLSKKAAAGSTHVVIDIPVGSTAKVRSVQVAQKLSALLMEVGRAVGLTVRTVITDGSQPVGRGIGPALEARDVLAVLRCDANAPIDLRERALALAGSVIEFAPGIAPGTGVQFAREILDDGRAWSKFQAICAAQGGMRVPPIAAYTHALPSPCAGHITHIDNRRLARVAKLAGAPRAPAAGLELHTPIGSRVTQGQPLFTVHAESPGELTYALDYVAAQADIVQVEEVK